MQHFDRTPARNAEFVTPPNLLKQKVGYGGLSEEILESAQKLLEENTHDFAPLGNIYLTSLMSGIDLAKTYNPDNKDVEQIIAAMIYPTMQLKANGAMFHYLLITKMADKLVQFLEVIHEPDIETVEIVLAFHTTMQMVLNSNIKGDGGDRGHELLAALDKVCVRYFDKHPEILKAKTKAKSKTKTKAKA